MMTQSNESKSEMKRALADFEQCLETPVVPGELPEWCRMADGACERLSTRLRQEIAEAHPPIYEQIIREDAEMGSRVEAMRQTDRELAAQLEKVVKYVEQLTTAASAVEPHESRLDEYVQKAVDAGLALVLEVRKQETAITTWYRESLERDRGNVD